MSSPHVLPVADFPDADHFAAPVCRNCGAALNSKFCGNCGQEKAKRFRLRAVGTEAWQNWRWFEWDVLKSAWRLLTQPGNVAREYVLGARKKHVHPLKLLLLAIGAMLLVVTRVNYFDSSNADVSPAMELVRAWSNWAFSLAILAILTSSLLVFRRRGGFNLTEHLVLAVYCHFLVICASVVNKLPVLMWRSAEFLAAHKLASAWYMDSMGVLIVSVAFTQFFRLELRRDGWRLLLAAAVFVATKWVLVRAYAYVVAKVVLAQLA